MEKRMRLLPSWGTAGRGSGAEGGVGRRSQGRSCCGRAAPQLRSGCCPSEAGRGRGKWTQQPAALTSSPPLTSSLTSHCPRRWFSQASSSFPPQCLCTCCFLGPTGPPRWAVWASFHHAPLQMSLPREVSRSLCTARPTPIRLPYPQRSSLPSACLPVHVPSPPSVPVPSRA